MAAETILVLGESGQGNKLYLTYFNFDRKYEKYLEYCRLYKELYKELESKNEEGWDANLVLNSEITKGSESV